MLCCTVLRKKSNSQRMYSNSSEIPYLSWSWGFMSFLIFDLLSFCLKDKNFPAHSTWDVFRVSSFPSNQPPPTTDKHAHTHFVLCFVSLHSILLAEQYFLIFSWSIHCCAVLITWKHLPVRSYLLFSSWVSSALHVDISVRRHSYHPRKWQFSHVAWCSWGSCWDLLGPAMRGRGHARMQASLNRRTKDWNRSCYGEHDDTRCCDSPARPSTFFSRIRRSQQRFVATKQQNRDKKT